MIAVFARPNHPNYSRPDYDTWEWRYHGYSVIFVQCNRTKDVAAVANKLREEGLPEPFGHAYEQGWYGGKMDLLTVLRGNKLAEHEGGWNTLGYFAPVRPGHVRTSIGDNRYAGFYTAAEILASARPQEGS